MAGIDQKFLKRCVAFGVRIVKLTETFPNNSTWWSIKDQIVRSGMSIGANFSESHGANSRADFRRSFDIALKSGNETKYWLLIVKELDLSKDNTIDQLLSELHEICSILAASIISLKKSRK